VAYERERGTTESSDEIKMLRGEGKVKKREGIEERKRKSDRQMVKS
jgi:hypothetical protein